MAGIPDLMEDVFESELASRYPPRNRVGIDRHAPGCYAGGAHALVSDIHAESPQEVRDVSRTASATTGDEQPLPRPLIHIDHQDRILC
jgi:hypothetical protein